jgi:ApaG protein
MTEAVDNRFIVSVDTTHLPEFELNPPYKHFFSYQITIKNTSNQTAQLVSRYWDIVDGIGQKETVNGLGVVGQQPIIEPGNSFTYTSGCPLISSMGKMSGYYIFLNLENQSTFKVEIPSFELIPAYHLN